MKVFQQTFSLAGRIGRPAFFATWLAIGAAQLILLLIPPVGLIALIPANFMVICLLVKRFRTIGFTGWHAGALAVLPFALCLLYAVLVAMFAVLTIGCCGSGSGGSDSHRAIYSSLTGTGNSVVVAMFAYVFIAGVWPGKSDASVNHTSRLQH